MATGKHIAEVRPRWYRRKIAAIPVWVLIVVMFLGTGAALALLLTKATVTGSVAPATAALQWTSRNDGSAIAGSPVGVSLAPSAFNATTHAVTNATGDPNGAASIICTATIDANGKLDITVTGIMAGEGCMFNNMTTANANGGLNLKVASGGLPLKNFAWDYATATNVGAPGSAFPIWAYFVAGNFGEMLVTTPPTALKNANATVFPSTAAGAPRLIIRVNPTHSGSSSLTLTNLAVQGEVDGR